MSAAATLPRDVTAQSRLRVVVQSMMTGLRTMVVGYWLVMVLAFLVLGLSFQVVTGGVDHSMWDYGTQSPKYFSAAIGITLTPALFTLLVAHGVTRRMYAVASSISLVGAAAATSLLWLVVYQVEHLIYASQGWEQTLSNPHLFTKTSQAGLVFGEFFLLIVSHEVAGWLIGISFYRLGFWKGLGLLPVGLIPAVAAEFLLVTGWIAQALSDNTAYDRPPLALAALGVTAVCALGMYVGYLLIRPMGLKPAKG